MTRLAVKEGLFTGTDGTADPQLLGSRCRSCRRYAFPAHAFCPYCSASDCESSTLGRHGTLELCTSVVNRPPGYEGALPFGFGVVQLPQGLRVIARIANAAGVRPGCPVHLVLETLQTDADGHDIITYAFAPSN